MPYERILKHAQLGTLRPTFVAGLRFTLGRPGQLSVEVVDNRATNLSRFCVSAATLDLVELRRIVRRFEPIDDV